MDVAAAAEDDEWEDLDDELVLIDFPELYCCDPSVVFQTLTLKDWDTKQATVSLNSNQEFRVYTRSSPGTQCLFQTNSTALGSQELVSVGTTSTYYIAEFQARSPPVKTVSVQTIMDCQATTGDLHVR